MVNVIIILDQCLSTLFSHGKYFTLEKSQGTPPKKNVIKRIFLKIQCTRTLNLLPRCEIWACLIEHKVDILAGINERKIQRSSSTALYFCIFPALYQSCLKISPLVYIIVWVVYLPHNNPISGVHG